MRRAGVVLAVVLAALAAAAAAPAATVFVLQGRGWGHGIGMSQWGARGYARHGWSYRRILAHYYPGTRLGAAPLSRVRVLVADGVPVASVGCAGAIHVADRTGRGHVLGPGFYRLGRRLLLPVGTKRVRVRARHHRRARVRVVSVHRPLAPPLVLDCPSAPLVLDGTSYHGLLVVRRAHERLSFVNSLPLDEYVAGVVGREMPFRWNMAALEAQAVVARSYALATRKPRGDFDLYADTRSQVYGGIGAETARTDLAVRRTAGRVLLWDGVPAQTFFFSTSGGRTAAIRDVWPRAQALPYLRSVSDPYEQGSPHLRWGPVVVTAQELRARLHVRRADTLALRRNGSGRVAGVVVGGRMVPGWRFARAAGLDSTWFAAGRLSLRPRTARLAASGAVTLAGAVEGLRGAVLQQLRPDGTWRTLRRLGAGSFAVHVHPGGRARYRLRWRGVASPPVAVAAAPPHRARPRTLAAHRT